MKGSIRAVLATSAALGLTAFGVAPASAGQSSPKPPQVVADDWVHDVYKFPAGTACKDKIKVNEKYHYKLTVLKDTERYVKLREEFDHGYAKFYNPKTGRSVKVHLDSVGYVVDNKRTATARVRERGSTYFQGLGIKGIAYLQGKYTFTITNTQSGPEKSEFHIDEVHGKYVELCRKLGSSPVNGKLVIPPSFQQPQS
jgi:hypothetical protein